MKKTILSLAMMLMMTLGAAAAPVIKATPDSKEQVEFKGDTMVVSDGDNQVTVTGLPGLQKVRDKINKTLDDTLTASNGESVDLGFGESDLTAEDMKYMSDHWGEVLKQICYASIAGVLGLVFLVLLFRFMNRRVTPEMLPEQAAEESDPRDDELAAAVLRLPLKLREAVLLHHYQGLNVNETAEALGISHSSASGRLKRGREKLKELLEGSELYEP